MPQIFHPSMNTVARVSIFGALFFVAAVFGIVFTVVRSPYVTEVGVVREQPVPFSHKHHVGAIGIDCRYCHTSVETSAVAGMPPTQTCMNCHSQLWRESPMLQPVRVSYQTDKPLKWTRVYDLPDFAYFDHSIHLHKGIGCSTCHGQVDEMPLMWRETSLQMQWCLDCHRNPSRFVRPREEVFNMDWRPEDDPGFDAARLITDYHIQSKTNCSICHR
jgi:hypothetical protein